MKQAAKIGSIAALVLLAACGKVGPLEPRAGSAAPAKSYGQETVPGAEELLTASEQARPGRSDELMRRSERRSNDPFDLPPGDDLPKDKKPEQPVKTPTPK
jgi:predicted small lipoprotein YifL